MCPPSTFGRLQIGRSHTHTELFLVTSGWRWGWHCLGGGSTETRLIMEGKGENKRDPLLHYWSCVILVAWISIFLFFFLR